jgi:hypothetical protein
VNRPIKKVLCGAICACACATGPAVHAKVTIELDYSLDTNGFFLPQSQNPFGFDGDTAKAVLQRAANNFSDRFVDRLTEVKNVPGEQGGEWSQVINHPATGQQYEPGLTAVGAGVIKVYAGGRNLPGTTLGVGGPGGMGYGYFPDVPESVAWKDNLLSRGQAGVLANPSTDYSAWGGAITFDTDANWHISLSTTGLTTTKSDFYSVALHELAHLLGVGTADSWNALRSGGQFLGPKSTALKGGPIPLSADQAHWANSTQSTVGPGGPAQETVMDPSLTTGTRKRFTLLDWAALDDIGWQLAEPGDATADGAVDFNDLAAMAQNYNVLTGRLRWAEGDFTEDGNVDFNDLAVLAQHYNTSTPIEGAAVAAAFGESFASDWQAALNQVQPVPEPTTAALITGAALIVSRRRRKV